MRRRNVTEPKPLIESLEGRAMFSATLADTGALAAPTRYPRVSAPVQVAAKTSTPEDPSPTETNLVVISIIAVLIAL